MALSPVQAITNARNFEEDVQIAPHIPS